MITEVTQGLTVYAFSWLLKPVMKGTESLINKVVSKLPEKKDKSQEKQLKEDLSMAAEISAKYEFIQLVRRAQLAQFMSNGSSGGGIQFTGQIKEDPENQED